MRLCIPYTSALPSELHVQCICTCTCISMHAYVAMVPQEKMRGRNKLVPRLLGITRESIMRVDENTKEVLKTWPLTTVRRWAASPNSFTLVSDTHSHTHTHTHTHSHTHTHTLTLYIYTYTQNTYTHTHSHTFTHTCTCIYSTYIHTHSNSHTHKHPHTHTHTHTHTHVCQ